MTLDRRALLLGSSALSLSALTACRATDDEPSSGTSGTGAPAAESGAFPVTIKHKFGSTTITKAPKRIVLVGLVEQDMLLALGIRPVAVSEWLKGAKDEIYPWARPELGKQKAPKVLPQSDGIPVEQVAALKPDLILGNYAGVTAAEYKRLTKIAPTVAQPKEYLDYGVPWDVNALIVAKAVGKSAEGKRIVGAVRKQLADAKKKHAAFVGKTAMVLTAFDGVYMYGPQDPRSRLLDQLGFTFPKKFEKVGDGKEFGGQISPERTRELDFDVVIWLSTEKETVKGTGNLWKQTKAHQQGRSIYIPYETKIGTLATTYSAAFSFLTPLSIPYLLDNLVPQLAAAVDGDPSTKVPGPKPFRK